MIKVFLKRNWLYIALLCLIILLNVAPRLGEKEEVLKDTEVAASVEPEKEEPPSLFVDFDEAQERSKKIEIILKKKPATYLFYISVNLALLLIVLLGLILDGYFVVSKFKKRTVFKSIHKLRKSFWEISDIFKIVILALSFSYLFFILFGIFSGFLEKLLNVKFTLYQSENFRMIFDTIVFDAIILLVVLKFLRHIYRKRLAVAFGFVKKNIGRNIFYGILAYIGIIPVIFIIGILVYILLNILEIKPPPQPIVGLFLAEKNAALIFASSIIAAVFGPFIEEVFFRGVMYSAVKRKLGIFWSILITSMLFSFLHTHAMTYFLVGFIPITILGMVLAYLYEKTGSLIPSITLHMLNNLGSVIMVFLFKYFNNLTG